MAYGLSNQRLTLQAHILLALDRGRAFLRCGATEPALVALELSK